MMAVMRTVTWNGERRGTEMLDLLAALALVALYSFIGIMTGGEGLGTAAPLLVAGVAFLVLTGREEARKRPGSRGSSTRLDGSRLDQ